MKAPQAFQKFEKELILFPLPLQKLVECELRAGNSIVMIDHRHPAAPCGASVRLARPVQPERRVSNNEITFRERNNSSHSGEFTTAERHFFVLEPPLSPDPIPDMDAIRQEMRDREHAENEKRFRDTYYFILPRIIG